MRETNLSTAVTKSSFFFFSLLRDIWSVLSLSEMTTPCVFTCWADGATRSERLLTLLLLFKWLYHTQKRHCVCVCIDCQPGLVGEEDSCCCVPAATCFKSERCPRELSEGNTLVCFHCCILWLKYFHCWKHFYTQYLKTHLCTTSHLHLWFFSDIYIYLWFYSTSKEFFMISWGRDKPSDW